MSELFDKCFKIVVGEEGGYVNNPKDPGGETKFGITKKSYPTLDIKNLTIDKAKAIYKASYWDKCKCDDMPFMMALPVFDAAINCGVGEAQTLLRKAAGFDGMKDDLASRAKASNQPEQMLVEFMVQQLMFKIHLRIFQDFGLGWTRRAIRIAIKAGQH